MRIVSSLDELHAAITPASRNGGAVVTIGVYDGVHRGHHAVLRLVRELADARGLAAVCITFDRHPAEVVRPESAPKLLTGTSLGSNNLPIVAAYVYRRNSNIIIHGMWGFQASQGGAKAIEGTDYNGIPPNVLFAHLVSSDNPLNFGLGSYRWQKAPGNTVTNLILDHNMDVHPGDGNLNTQNMFLAEMKRVVEQA